MYMSQVQFDGVKRTGGYTDETQLDNKRARRAAEPSKVVHVRNLPEGISEYELLELVRPYGNVEKTLILGAKGQAFVQMDSVAASTNLINAFTISPPNVRGRHVGFQFSTRQEISREASKRDDVAPNRILLVSVADMRAAVQIEHLEQVFSAHGLIEKIVIFEKNGFHAFVEMQSVEDATRAMHRLNGQSLFIGCCTLTVQYSTLEKLNIPQNPDPRLCRDYGTLREANKLGLVGGAGMLPQSAMTPGAIAPGAIGAGSTQHQQATMFGAAQPRYFVPQPNPVLQGGGDESKPGQQQQQQIQQQPTYDMFGTSSFAPLGGFPGAPGSTLRQQPSDGKINLEPGGVLFVNNLDEEKVTPDALFNLFGVFGDVYRVKILFKKKSSALVQMANATHANLVLNYLNHHVLWGKELHITQSKYQEIQMPRNPQEDSLTKDYSTSRGHRFRRIDSKNFKNLCAPSHILHLSNLPDPCEDKQLYELFAEYEVRKIQFFQSNRSMALIEMPNSDIAAQLLIRFHDFVLDGKNMKISFSRKLAIPQMTQSDAVSLGPQPQVGVTEGN